MFTSYFGCGWGARRLKKICAKSCCQPPQLRLVDSKAFYDCSGGNSRPSRLSGVGGGNFLRQNICLFLLARDHALARLRLKRKAQTKPSNVELSKTAPLRVADRVHNFCADHCKHDRSDFLASGELAGALGTTKQGRARATRQRFARGFYRHRARAATHYDQQPHLYGADHANERTGCSFAPHRSRTRTAPHLGWELESASNCTAPLSPKPDSNYSRVFRSTWGQPKSSCRCHTLRFSDLNSNKWRFSHLKTDYGTGFPGRMFKANCLSCLSWRGKGRRKAVCQLKPSKHCGGKSRNGFTRRGICV